MDVGTVDAASAPAADPDITHLSGGADAGARPSGTDRATLRPGHTFTARYTVLKLLGSGGMGEVYQAWDQVLAAPVALKIIRPELAGDPIAAQQATERFRRELRLARQVTHPNVVRIHDLGHVDDIDYLTMQFVQGDDLEVVVNRHGRLDVGRALAIGRQIADGLAAVHQAGIVHRDLKPANVILDADDRAILADFGISRALNAATVHTLPGSLMGTLDYMAPEQARGEAVDQRSDIYALGLILYELIAGGRPRTKSDGGLASLIERIEKGPPALSAVVPGIAADTERLVARCLAPDPSDRYQSAADVAADLNRLGPDGRLRAAAQGASFAPRRIWWVGAALAAAVALVAGTWGLAGRRAAPTAAPREAVSVLIADFRNDAQDPVFEGSLEQALGVAMEGASFISAYPRRSAAGEGTTLDEAAARLLAVKEGVRIVLSGTIARAGAGFTVAVRALDPTSGNLLQQATSSAAGKADVLEAIGRVAESLRRDLGDPLPADQLKAETFSAASLKALQSYTIAQVLSLDRRNEEAIKHYRAAIAEDPDFGRAYAGLALLVYESGRREEAKELWDKALTLIDRMTEREKYRTLGTYYVAVARNYDRAIETYTTLVSRYPADLAGHNNLAIAYFLTLRFQDALSEGRRAVELFPKSSKFRCNYALFAMYAGDFTGAAETARGVLETTPAYVMAYLPLAIEALAGGHIAAAKTAYEQAGRIDAEGASLAAIGLADIALYEGRYADAVAVLTPAIEVDLRQKDSTRAAAKMVVLAEAQHGAGQTAAVLKTIDAALKLSRDDSTVVPIARILMQIGQHDRAQVLIDELSERLQPQSRAYAKILEAERAIARNRAAEAMDALAASRKLADLWLGRFVAGVAYETFGHHVEARDELERCRQRKGEATALFLDDSPTFRYVAPAEAWLTRAQQAGPSTVAR